MPAPRISSDRSPAIPWIRIGLLLLALAGVAAFIADMLNARRRLTAQWAATPREPELIADLTGYLLDRSGAVYADPSGLFSVRVPANWNIEPRGERGFYNVILRAPRQVSVAIMATPVKYNDLQSLADDIRRNERRNGIATNLELWRFLDRPAIRRVSRLVHTEVLAIDFVAEYTAHHILCTFPRGYYDRYLPLVMQVLETYRPAARGATPWRRSGEPTSGVQEAGAAGGV